MLRESVVHPTDWQNSTMSVMREKQIEACEKRLSSYPQTSLFSETATDADAQVLYEHSYDISEGTDELITLESLRARVLSRLPLEATALSPAEISLMERLLISGGRLALRDIDEIAAAEALVCRLWCGYALSDDDTITLELPKALHQPLIEAMQSQECSEIRERLYRFDATVSSLIYIAGFLHSAQPVDCFMSDVLLRTDDMARHVALRYLKSAYDYIIGADKELILLHPGLVDPYRLVSGMNARGVFTLELSQDVIMGGMNGILPQEVALHERLTGALQGALRPEWEPCEAAQDLRMLCKQGVSLETLESVMETMLLMMPTENMKSAVKQLYLFTPHWLDMEANSKH